MRRDLKGSSVIAALSTTLLVSASTPLLAEGGVDGAGTKPQVKAGTGGRGPCQSYFYSKDRSL